MLNKVLISIDKSINDPGLKDKILVAKRGYYIYFNEPNKMSKKLKIHKHTCGHCAWGSGKLNQKIQGKNGVWLGPFTTVSQASTFIETYFQDLIERLEKCSCVSPAR